MIEWINLLSVITQIIFFFKSNSATQLHEIFQSPLLKSYTWNIIVKSLFSMVHLSFIVIVAVLLTYFKVTNSNFGMQKLLQSYILKNCYLCFLVRCCLAGHGGWLCEVFNFRWADPIQTILLDFTTDTKIYLISFWL